LHAAVGLAQIRKVGQFLAIQKKNHSQLKQILSQVPDVSFRTIPDPAGDSCTFLSWFLPSGEIAQAFVEEMKTQGILAGNFYWFNNNWHYISKWDHLKSSHFLNGQSHQVIEKLKSYRTQKFVASDAIMSRCISTSISLAWTEEQVIEKGEKIVSAIRKVL